MDNDSISYDYNELIEDLLAKQLVQDAYIAALSVFLRRIIREVKPELADEYNEMFRMLVAENIERSKVDNVFLNRSLNKKIRNELNGISGIEFSE